MLIDENEVGDKNSWRDVAQGQAKHWAKLSG